MKKEVSITAISVMIVLVFGYIAVSRYENTDVEKRDTILDFTQAELVRMSVKNSDDEYVLIRDNDEWKIENFDIEVLSGIVDGYFSDTLPMVGKKIENPADFSAYGLTDYDTQVVYTLKSGETRMVTLGDLTPSETEAYVCDDKGNVYTVYTQVSNALGNRMYSFVDDYVAGFNYDEISKIMVKNTTGTYTLVHDGQNWMYEESEKNADTFEIKSKITRYLRNIYSLKSYVKTEERLRKYDFGKDNARLEIIMTDGSKTVIETGLQNENELYITLDNSLFIYCVDSSCFRFLTGETERLQIDKYRKE